MAKSNFDISRLKQLPILTLEQASQIYPFKLSTLRAWCRAKKMDCVKLGKLYYVTHENIHTLLNKHRQNANKTADVILIKGR